MARYKVIPLLAIILLAAMLIPGRFVQAGPLPQDAQFTSTPQPPVTLATPYVPPAIPGLLPPAAEVYVPENANLISFDDFGFSEMTLRGPFAANAYYFDLPPTWRVQPGAELRLVLDTFFTSTTTNASVGPVYGGNLIIQYNYITIASINLSQEGQRQVVVPIPYDVLTRLAANQSQAIQFILDSGINCDVDFRTTVVIRTVSQLFVPHEQISPPTDLTLLPAPFFQDSFNRDSLVVIVPDEPTAEELQAALSVSAGFGRMTFNRLVFSVLKLSQVTSEILATTNVAFVGKASSFPQLAGVQLPLPVRDGVFAGADFKEGDSVVQIAASPWNKNRVVLVVGANEDASIINAARAFSTGDLRVGGNRSLSIVTGVQSLAKAQDLTSVDQSFETMGYDSQVVGEVGLNMLDYTFEIPQGYTIGPDAYVNLVFSHSSLLEYQRSNIVVRLNNEPIGSIRLSDETAALGQQKVFLPASAIRPGSNRLSLDIYLEPQNECVNPFLDGLWMRIDSASLLHLPYVPVITTASILADLKRYPAPLAFDPEMNDLAFVLARNDVTGWDVAAHIAFQLGNTNAIQIAALEVHYPDSIPDETKMNRNLIIVGRPSALPIISELSGVLPAPFEPGTDQAVEKNLQVSYRLSPAVDVGYIELLSAPWNAKRLILYVGGSSDLGLRWAGASLQLGRLRSQLSGNLAFVNGEQILSADTRQIQGVDSALATAVSSEVTPEASQISPTYAQRPAWMLSAIYISLAGILLVLLVLGIQFFASRKTGKPS